VNILRMSNSTERLSSDCGSSSLVTFQIVLSHLLFFLFPIALLLNGIASWVSLHLESTSTFIVYLKNLVAADLLITLMIPLKAAGMLPGATVEFRAFICRYAAVTFYCCLYTSIALMGLISLDRFFKIVRPCGKVLGQNMKFSVIMSTLVWILLFGGTAIPNIILTDQVSATQTDDLCMSLKPPAGKNFHKYVVLFMEILFWCVNILIVFCYICITMKVVQSFRNSGSNNRRGKKKTKLRVFLILLVFWACFVPLHLILRIPYTFQQVNYSSNSCLFELGKFAKDASLWLATTNTCIDPLLYVFLCREFKEKLVSLMADVAISLKLASAPDKPETTLQQTKF
uniref:G-protein coupled receptors family 1 profile domain-containing protein n=1 Tax=Oreochromis aureus TaxID=47969 RepID=A0A668RJV5_OREAU